MPSVLLRILAVTGMVILIVLGIVICLLLMVLFIPISYRILADAKPGEKHAEAKINWFFGMIRLNISYSEKISWKLYFLWFDLSGRFQKKEKHSSRKKTINATKSENTKNVEIKYEDTNSEEMKLEETVSDETRSAVGESVENSDSAQESLSEKGNKLIFKIRLIYDKLKSIRNNVLYYINLIQEEDSKALATHCFGVLGKIIISIRPRKLKLQGTFGFDSPDTTGKIYGLLCMLYPYYGNTIHIVPDFENKILEGTLFCKGRIYGCILLINALRILLNKKLFKVIHKFKNGGKQKNGR